MRISIASLTLLVCASIASPALSLTIDNFEAGPFNVVDVFPGPTNGQQAGLSASDVIGGVRLVRSSATTSGGTTTNTLVTTGVPDSATVSFADALTPLGQGDAAYIYDGLADFVNNGTLGLLNVDLSVFLTIDVQSTGTPGIADYQLTLWDSSLSQSTIQPNVNGITSFLLSEFNLIDLTDINAIRIAVFSLDPFESVSIGNIYAIPEPTTGLLLTLGLAGLALRKTRGR